MRCDLCDADLVVGWVQHIARHREEYGEYLEMKARATVLARRLIESANDCKMLSDALTSALSREAEARKVISKLSGEGG